jgi:Zn-dependent protease with chaperone function
MICGYQKQTLEKGVTGKMENFSKAIIITSDLLAAMFLAIIFHELAHVVMYQEVHFIGFTFGENVAKTCGLTSVHDQEGFAWIITVIVFLDWFLSVNLIRMRRESR